MGDQYEHRRRLTLFATVLGSSLAFIDATVVIVALPTIERDLDLGLAGQQWVFLAYSLTLASLLLVSGGVGDEFGRRRTFVFGICAFAAASLFAGLAPGEVSLIAARALQGAAAAFMTTNSLALLRETYGDESGRAIGLWTSFTSAAAILGPPAGGALVEWVSWRWIFLVNLPLALAAVLLAIAGRCPHRTQERTGRLDVPGSILSAVGFAAITYGLVEGADRGIAAVWWTIPVTMIAFGLFVVAERRAANPLVPRSLLEIHNILAANVETFLVYAALGGQGLFFVLDLQFLGFGAFEAGLLVLPPSVAMILLSSRIGSLSARVGPRRFLAAGPALMAAGFALYLSLDEKSDFWTAGIAGLVLFSVGLALLVAPITTTAIGSAPQQLAGVASGVNMMVARVGSLVAVAVLGVVAAVVFEAAGGSSDAVPMAAGQTGEELRSASIDAFRAVMTGLIVLCLAAALTAWFWISDREALRRGDETPEPVPLGG